MNHRTAQPIAYLQAIVMGEEEYQLGNQLFMAYQYQQSLPYFERAAANLYPAAYLRLGHIYSIEDINLPTDRKKSDYYFQKAATEIEWFKTRAKEGTADAFYNFSICCLKGCGVPRNERLGFMYHQMAADFGLARAQFNIGEWYAEGSIVTKNDENAFQYYQSAAAQGHADAQFAVGICYTYGKGVAKNNEMAIKYLKLAADQGHADAQCLLGLYYGHGRGVVQSNATAFMYFQLAADQINPLAESCLGTCYGNGQGVAQNDAMAVMYFQFAAKQESADGQFNLGLCYAYGRGVVQNNAIAFMYFQLAADQGHVQAKQMLSQKKSQLHASQVDSYGQIFAKRSSVEITKIASGNYKEDDLLEPAISLKILYGKRK